MSNVGAQSPTKRPNRSACAGVAIACPPVRNQMAMDPMIEAKLRMKHAQFDDLSLRPICIGSAEKSVSILRSQREPVRVSTTAPCFMKRPAKLRNLILVLGDQLGERSLQTEGIAEGTLTPLMQAVEREFPGVRVFSLPHMDPERQVAYHIELGVKGPPAVIEAAFARLAEGVAALAGQVGAMAEERLRQS